MYKKNYTINTTELSMAMHYLPYALDSKSFAHKCPYCYCSNLALERIVSKTIEYKCQNCFKIFVIVPYPQTSDIKYPISFSDDSGLEDFIDSLYLNTEQTY